MSGNAGVRTARSGTVDTGISTSHYVMAGGNLLTLQKILGHSKFEATQIYSHLAPDYMAGEVARLSFGLPVALASTGSEGLPL